MRPVLIYTVLIAATVGITPLWAQTDYSTLAQIGSRLSTIDAQHNEATLITLGMTAGGNEIWALELGRGDRSTKPATAIVAGVEGYQLVGVEMSLRIAERILKDHGQLLESHTFYILPNVSPDAYGQYFGKVRYERRGNAAQIDHDRDGTPAEDGYDDLNNDGLITHMRVRSPIGDHMVADGDDRILRPADRSKGERGSYLLLSEGRDNDGDGKINEDLSEGVAFNKSLTYQFPAFEPLAGDYPVSQDEVRAVLDYLYERNNIYSVFSFSPADNLSQPLVYNASNAQKRVVTSILEGDAVINKRLSERYAKLTAAVPANANPGTPGDFFQWAYFHFGRLSLSTPGWWVPEIRDGEGRKYTLPEANFLAWADSVGIQDVFVPWTPISHPDFPNQTVEVGGIKPFVRHNPPLDMVDSLVTSHLEFLVRLAEEHPRLEFHELTVERLDRDLSRVTVKLFNNAPLPTHTEMGRRSRWFQKVRIELDRPVEDILTGSRITLVDALDAYDSQKYSWLVRGGGSFTIRAGAPHTGFTSIQVSL